MSDEKTGARGELGIIEKAFLMGIGAAAFAKEKIEELADELIERGTLTREQSDSFINRLAKEADDATRSVQSTVARETERVVAGMGLASAKDVQELRDELAEIKAMIASLRSGGGTEQA